jgi:hypothetical protein
MERKCLTQSTVFAFSGFQLGEKPLRRVYMMPALIAVVAH